jgi:hypothetical protein
LNPQQQLVYFIKTVTIIVIVIVISPVVLGCGAKIAENCTYFQSASSSQAAGQCGVTICKCSTDICQVFFTLFAIHFHHSVFIIPYLLTIMPN